MYKKNRFLTVLVVALFVVITNDTVAYASPLYIPGQTLTPSCLPTDPDCTVSLTNLSGLTAIISNLNTVTSPLGTNAFSSTAFAPLASPIFTGTVGGITASMVGAQPLSTNLTSIAGLANGTGWLYNNGSGIFTYTTPTATNIGLGNVTNNAQIAGLASGTTSGHLVVWGANGYTVADGGVVPSGSGITLTTTGSSGAATFSSNVLNIPQYSGGSSYPSLTENSTTLVSTKPISATSFTATGSSDSYINLPSNTSHAAASYDFWNNAGVLQFNNGSTTNNVLTISGTPSDGCAQFSSGVISSTGTACGSGSGGVSAFNTRTGSITLTSGDVTTALGFTPANSPGSVYVTAPSSPSDSGTNGNYSADSTYFYLYKTGWHRIAWDASWLPTVATPTFSPVAGAVLNPTTVTFSSTTAGVTFCSTQDNSTPTASAGTCTHGSTGSTTSVTTAVTVQVIATESGYVNSGVASAAYTISVLPQAATPTFSPVAGTYFSTQTVTISSATSGSTICYTTDNSTPTSNGSGTCTHGTTYAGTVSVASTETLEAIASKSGDTDSTLGSAAYTILLGTVATPTFSPVAGAVTNPTTVTVSSATPASGVTYCITQDGSTPTGSSGSCTNGTLGATTSVASAVTVKAIGCATNYACSAVGSAAYTIASLYAKTVTVGSGSGCGGSCTYASLQAAITGEVAANANLTTLGGILEIKLYAITDTTAVTVAGFSGTDATHYVLIHPNSSAQHSGVWNGSLYNLSVSGSTALAINQDYTRVQGLQISLAPSSDGQAGISVNSLSSTVGNGVVISGNLIRHTGTPGRANSGIRLITPSGGVVYVYNNLVYNFTDGTNSCAGISEGGLSGASTAYVYGNTLINDRTGILGLRNLIAKDNLISGSGFSSMNLSVGAFAAGTDYNATDQTTMAGSGTFSVTGGGNIHDRVSQTFTFTNSAGADYSLNTGDTGAKGFGVNLSSDPNLQFTTNAAGTARGSTWNIGAF